jgi:hypothetical protein
MELLSLLIFGDLRPLAVVSARKYTARHVLLKRPMSAPPSDSLVARPRPAVLWGDSVTPIFRCSFK